MLTEQIDPNGFLAYVNLVAMFISMTSSAGFGFLLWVEFGDKFSKLLSIAALIRAGTLMLSLGALHEGFYYGITNSAVFLRCGEAIFMASLPWWIERLIGIKETIKC